ncbi:hypothetical protein PoB_001594100 [Plakobranchus ocellatus]|uniref:Uncharacterized protein n=1 Tax=Plakobranchus ocellatus TaxID=259542 RepID=A0AAV3YQL6_9GAST|nr:hypothetical protein PoB_001594100 [Plakobranchus ocellatus]
MDEATTYILQYQFNHAAVYDRREDRFLKRQSVLSALDGTTVRRDLHHVGVQGMRLRSNRGAEAKSQERGGENGCETGRTSWDSRSCLSGHSKISPPQEVLNPNGLDPSHQPQKLVNPNGLDPPDQQKHKEKLGNSGLTRTRE